MQLNKGCLYFHPNIFKFIQSCFIYIFSNRQAPFVSVFALFCLCYCFPDMITRQDVFNAELVSLNTFSIPQCTLVRLNIPLFAAIFQFLDRRLGLIHPPVKAKPRLLTTAMIPISIMIGNTLCVHFFCIFNVFETTNQKTREHSINPMYVLNRKAFLL